MLKNIIKLESENEDNSIFEYYLNKDVVKYTDIHLSDVQKEFWTPLTSNSTNIKGIIIWLQWNEDTSNYDNISIKIMNDKRGSIKGNGD